MDQKLGENHWGPICSVLLLKMITYLTATVACTELYQSALQSGWEKGLARPHSKSRSDRQ